MLKPSTIKLLLAGCLALASTGINAQTISFTAPDTICVGTQVSITNSSSGSNYYWTGCAAALTGNPIVTNLGNLVSSLSQPVFSTVVKDNSNYYLFSVNHENSGNTGSLLRYDYGTSLLNVPTVSNLGDLSAIPRQAEKIQIIKSGNNWYALIVGGQNYGTTPSSNSSRIVTINFGASITNSTPTAVNYGNVGLMEYPLNIFAFQETGNWYAYVTNFTDGTLTRLSFGSSLANTPTGTNLGNIGALNAPHGVTFFQSGDRWYAYIANYFGNNIVLYDFGTSLLNTPTASNLGNPGNLLNYPRDLKFLQTCDQKIIYVLNEGNNKIIRLNYSGAGFAGPYTAVDLGNLGNIDHAHGFSDFTRMGDSLYTFISNYSSNTISRMAIGSCSGPFTSSTATTPSAVSFSTPGIYNIKLFMDEGLPTQAALCKQIVAIAAPSPVITQTANVLSTGIFTTYQWYKNGVAIPGATQQNYTTSTDGTYYVIVTNSHGCSNQSQQIIVKSNSVTNSPLSSMIQVFPNPANNVLFIKSPVKVNAVLSSVDGKKVIDEKNASTIQLNHLARGYYLLSLTDEEGKLILVEKIIKSE